MLLKQAVRTMKNPFRIYDPFYSEQNQAELQRRAHDVERGVNVVHHELVGIDNEQVVA